MRSYPDPTSMEKWNKIGNAYLRLWHWFALCQGSLYLLIQLHMTVTLATLLQTVGDHVCSEMYVGEKRILKSVSMTSTLNKYLINCECSKVVSLKGDLQCKTNIRQTLTAFHSTDKCLRNVHVVRSNECQESKWQSWKSEKSLLGQGIFFIYHIVWRTNNGKHTHTSVASLSVYYDALNQHA